jgi:hypothetical protein
MLSTSMIITQRRLSIKTRRITPDRVEGEPAGIACRASTGVESSISMVIWFYNLKLTTAVVHEKFL